MLIWRVNANLLHESLCLREKCLFRREISLITLFGNNVMISIKRQWKE